MTWLTWRQHRLEVAIIGLVTGVVAAALIVGGLQIRALFPDGIEACIGTNACPEAWLRFDEDFGVVRESVMVLNLAPFLIGVFLGAPMLTRELESGTWQLAWTQTVPRMRWLAVKLTALGATAVLFATALSGAVGYFSAPENAFSGRFEQGFDLEGVTPAAYALFAFAAGAAAAVVLRRGVAAITAAAAVFLAVRLSVVAFLRPAYATPDTLTQPITPGDPAEVSGYEWMATRAQDWVLEAGYADMSGRAISWVRYAQLRQAAKGAGIDPATYLHDRGIQRYAIVQPGDRFWMFQYIEATIFAGLAAVLIGYVVWRIRRCRV